MLSAIHRVGPERAYEEVKQLAISIEQSKTMFGTTQSRAKRERYQDWKLRAKQYASKMSQGSSECEDFRGRASDSVRRESISQGEHDRLRSRQVNERERGPSARDRTASERAMNEERKCYFCHRSGHIARSCPAKQTQVRNIRDSNAYKGRQGKEVQVSDIIDRVRSCSVSKVNRGDDVKRVGNLMYATLRLLGVEAKAMIDSGSMISIVPISVLEAAQRKGFDVDCLEARAAEDIDPVYDASNNRMDIVGTVRIPVELVGGLKNVVEFHISP